MKNFKHPIINVRATYVNTLIQKNKGHRICKTNTKNRCEIKNIRISSLFDNVTAACVNTLRLKAKHIYKLQIYKYIYIYIYIYILLN